MWSQTKSSGRKLLEGQGVCRNLDPNIQSEKQNIRPLNVQKFCEEPWIGQERAGMRRRRLPPINQTIAQSSETSKKISEVSKIEKKIITHPYFMTVVQSVNNPSMEAVNKSQWSKTFLSILIQLTDLQLS